MGYRPKRETVSTACALCAFLLLSSVLQTEAFGADLSSVFDAALEGDMVKALAALDSLEGGSLSAKDSSTARCMRETFSTPPRTEDIPPTSQKILLAYRQYWHDVMMKRLTAEDAERTLLSSLNEILPHDGTRGMAFTSLDDASETAKESIEQEGMFAITGVTRPYYELMIWKKQSPVSYHVQLVEREIDVNVVFLDGFVSLGWAGYATCGRAHSGGWATTDSLFALTSAYDTGSEQFRVSYLAHEGRHFSDYAEFPKLEQPELEYRAKLTELAMSKQTTHDLIVAFAARTRKDRLVPHHLANYYIVRDLSRKVFRVNEAVNDVVKWRAIPARRIRHEAERLLKQNDYFLQREGATSIKQFLEMEHR